MKLKCIIIDDEPLARKVLQEYVSATEDLELTGLAENAEKGKQLIEEFYADVIFLDIEMPVTTGIELLKTIHAKPMVIFTTAFQEYAIEGFEFDIVDFLLKPIAFERFTKAVQKAREFYKYKFLAETEENYFFIKVDQKFEKILFTDILYAEAMNNYVTLHTARKKILCYITFKALEEKLPDELFIKIHKSYIVSTRHIEAIEGNSVKISGTVLPVSKTYKADVAGRVLLNKIIRRK